MSVENYIPLSRLAPELAPVIAGPTPSYRFLADRMRSGVFPVQRVGNRYFVERGSLPAIAQALGLPLASGPVQVAA